MTPLTMTGYIWLAITLWMTAHWFLDATAHLIALTRLTKLPALTAWSIYQRELKSVRSILVAAAWAYLAWLVSP